MRKISITFLILIIGLLLVQTIRYYAKTLPNKNEGALAEEHAIGIVSGYNSRVEEAQKILKTSGFDPGAIDGRIGAKTRKALKKFQEAKGLVPTGKIDFKTWSELNKQLNSQMPAQTGANIEPEKAMKQSEIQDEIISYRLKSKDRTKQIQTALKKAGFYKGDIDGYLGLETKNAIKAFQRSKGLGSDGIVGPKTWEYLSKYLLDEGGDK